MPANPLLWLHLLSLDAPLVAAVWQLFVGACTGERVWTVTTIVLTLVVWVIYISDRVLDTFRTPPSASEALRHRFARRHRGILLLASIVLGAITFALALFDLRTHVIYFGLLGGAGLALYFLSVHRGIGRRLAGLWSKEFAVALFFAVGVFGPIWTGPGDPRHILPLPFLSFLLLCWMNVAAIENWEADGTRVLNATTRWIGGHLAPLAILLSAVAVASWTLPVSRVEIAASLAALLIAVLDRWRAHIDRDLLRVSADLALLTPLLLFP